MRNPFVSAALFAVATTAGLGLHATVRAQSASAAVKAPGRPERADAERVPTSLKPSAATAPTTSMTTTVAGPSAAAAANSTPAPFVGGPVAIEPQWRDSFAAFDAADAAHPPSTGGVLFVGSSSIRLWDDLEQQFGPERPVVKRGFGGSRMFDCAQYAARLVLPYKPRLVVVYAGDNDLAEGRSPQDVLQNFSRFVETVRAQLPQTRIAYLSIKPSPLRATLMPSIRETNALIRAYAQATPNLDFIDIYSRMLDEQGRPRADLFRDDRLHLNPQGYALWKSVIAEHLR